jgi:hypothetical protein
LLYWWHCFYHKWILWKSFEQIGWDIAMIERKQLTMETSPLFVQLKLSSLDLYLPDKESNLKSKRSKQLSRSLHQKQSNKSAPSSAW